MMMTEAQNRGEVDNSETNCCCHINRDHTTTIMRNKIKQKTYTIWLRKKREEEEKIEEKK